MKELYNVIERFQALKEKTGTNKSTSYQVLVHFDCWSDDVTVEFGGYDVGNWSRHEYMTTTKENLIKDMNRKVDEAYLEVEKDLPENEDF